MVAKNAQHRGQQVRVPKDQFLIPKIDFQLVRFPNCREASRLGNLTNIQRELPPDWIQGHWTMCPRPPSQRSLWKKCGSLKLCQSLPGLKQFFLRICNSVKMTNCVQLVVTDRWCRKHVDEKPSIIHLFCFQWNWSLKSLVGFSKILLL